MFFVFIKTGRSFIWYIDGFKQHYVILYDLNVAIQDIFKNGISLNSENGILQISTSYSSGWKAYVDGKQTEIINVNTGFIGIPIEEGEHEIYLMYFTPCLKVGIIISILSIVILIFIIKNTQNLRGN